MRNIYWLRDDLRLYDNLSLTRFCAAGGEGAIVWFPSASVGRAEIFRKRFIEESLVDLESQLKNHGFQLMVFDQSASSLLPKICGDNQIEGIYCSYSPGIEEQVEVSELRRKVDATIHEIDQGLLVDRSCLIFPHDRLPDVFTSFRKHVEARLAVPNPLTIPTVWPQALSLTLDVKPCELAPRQENYASLYNPQFKGGERMALLRLHEYIWKKDCLKSYKDTRNGMVKWDDSTKLSPWIAVGALSVRLVFQEIKKYEQERVANDSTYWLFFELLWRDYFRLNAEERKDALFTKKAPISTTGRPEEEQTALFRRWAEGETGHDFIDANMIELKSTGWMSNRGRQNVASFLSKRLCLPWQWGADHFERWLIDYELCSNWGNWSYVAGVGQDPRNRIFNPDSQAQAYDPTGGYRQRWLNSRREHDLSKVLEK